GMGDVIFAPLYSVLLARGVKFKFFHRVVNLGLSKDKKSIETVEISRQVNLKYGSYDPIKVIKELPCWPAEPLYDQITEGEALKAGNINLESFWTPWEDKGGPLTLQAGTDFDRVVLGISLGALPFLCSELINARPDTWGAMVK